MRNQAIAVTLLAAGAAEAYAFVPNAAASRRRPAKRLQCRRDAASSTFARPPHPQRSYAARAARASASGAAHRGRAAPLRAAPGSSSAPPPEPTLYAQRWVQLAVLSGLALLSDWVCFATAARPAAWEATMGHDPAQLIDIFLFANVASCFLFTDVARKFGLRNCITWASSLMAVGCLLRSGVNYGGLPPYAFEVAGTVAVGAAQPFFQCSPPLLSATWFGSRERALSTAVAINFNQVGIATAFIVGGAMVHGDPGPMSGATGYSAYFAAISAASLAATALTWLLFQEEPPTPPSASAAAARAAREAAPAAAANDDAAAGFSPARWLTYPATAVQLVKTPGFLQPLAAFVASIGVTNVFSAFTEDGLTRAGILSSDTVVGVGAGFQLAIVFGGIALGGYVDRTKLYKNATMACLFVTLTVLIVLGVAEGYMIDLPNYVVVGAVLALGAAAGPVQPINAELAVEVTHPLDENAVEATQQLCGNLFSALLVPLCEVAANYDFAIMPGVGPDEDIRGDTIALILLVAGTAAYFSRFDAPLKRDMLDQAGGGGGGEC